MPRKIALHSQGVSHWFGSKKVLHNVEIKIIEGQIVSLVGPSGCGKSTLLRAVVGTHPPKKGSIAVLNNGGLQTISKPGRDRGIVYQHYSLFPYLTAIKNVAYGLMLDQTTLWDRLSLQYWRTGLRRQHLDKAHEYLVKVGLEQAANKYPHELSGGMQQRVAIAQALIMEPKVLLLDEPFGALDEATREELQQMLLWFYQENIEAKKAGKDRPYTIVIVTHELTEALYVGDRVIGLSQYWNWKQQGYKEFPGATIVYDDMAPVYHPNQQKEYEHFAAQRAQIRKFVYDSGVLQDPRAHQQFWNKVRAGQGGGILI